MALGCFKLSLAFALCNEKQIGLNLEILNKLAINLI
jgi:hypothetical protein